MSEKNALGYTPLMMACLHNDLVLVTELLATPNGDKNINEQDSFQGNTALHLAVQCEYESLVKLLLEQKQLDINKKNHRGETALLLAIAKRNLSLVTALLANPMIDRNASNLRNITPLMVAVNVGDNLLVELLLQDPDIKINAQDNQGLTALMLAIQKNDRNIARSLLSYPLININVKNFHGDTALHLATEQGNHAMISLLCTDPLIALNEKNNAGMTAWDIAFIQKAKQCLSVLEAHPDIVINNDIDNNELLSVIFLTNALNQLALLLDESQGHNLPYEIQKNFSAIQRHIRICRDLGPLIQQEHAATLENRLSQPLLLSQGKPTSTSKSAQRIPSHT